MILDASTSFASTCLSAAEIVDRSAVMLVGANRAAIFCNLTVSDTTASCATPAAVQHTAANTVVAHFVDMGTFYLSRRGWRLEAPGTRRASISIMPTMYTYRDLDAWKLGMDLVEECYRTTAAFRGQSCTVSLASSDARVFRSPRSTTL